MLDPQDRELLFDALRPDPGMVLDRGVGTSFTVDLEALLVAPLAFALFESDDVRRDPTALLAAIQQHAEHLAIYCDKAHIRPANQDQKLFVLLESSLLPVAAPGGGSFHPKLWVLRFRGAGSAPRHRVLVLSRNLTFDSSWDLIARLDEDQEGPLAGTDVAAVLQGLNRLEPSPITESLVESVTSVRFGIPEPFETAQLHALGLGSEPGPDPLDDSRGQRALVISPFLGSGRLRKLERLGSRRTLVSRGAELDRIGGAAIKNWGTPMVLRGGALPDAEEATDDIRTGWGLHAKLYLCDHDERATWFVGSANATASAFERNVETLLQLEGPVRRVGVAALLANPDKEVRFKTLLEEFPMDESGPREPTSAEVEEQRLESLVKEFSALPLEIVVTELADGYSLQLRVGGSLPNLASGDRLFARAVTRSSWTELASRSPELGAVRVLRSSEVTSLVAFRLQGNDEVPARDFVLRGTLVGAPEDRMDRLLVDLVPDQRRLALLLFLMLAASDPDQQGSVAARQLFDAGRNASENEATLAIPLYEALVRASARDIDQLRAVDRVVGRFLSTDEGSARLPLGFPELWESFRPLLEASG